MPDDLGKPDAALETAGGTTPDAAETISPPEVTDTAPGTDTTHQPADDSLKALDDAAGVEGYLAAKKEILAGKAPVQSEAPGEPEQTTEEEQAAPEEESSAPADETPPEAEIEETKVPDRIRLTGLKEKDRALVNAANLIAKAEGIDFGEAWQRVAGSREAKPAEAAPVQRTSEQIKAEIDALKTDKRKAAEELNTLGMIEIDDKLEGLRDELAETRRAADVSRAREEHEFVSAVDKNKAMAIKAYPDAGDDDSPLSKKAAEIADRLEAQGNPLPYQADAPWKIYQMAANELGIVPLPLNGKATPAAKPSTSATSKKPQAVTQRAVGRPTATAGIPAPGSARTSQPTGNPIDTALDSIRTVTDYEKAKQLAGLS